MPENGPYVNDAAKRLAHGWTRLYRCGLVVTMWQPQFYERGTWWPGAR